MCRRCILTYYTNFIEFRIDNLVLQQKSTIYWYNPHIHQVTIEFRFRKSLLQETSKSNLEFRYQIIVSPINFRKGFVKFMIPIALLKEFLSLQFISSVEISNIARCSSKTNELGDIDSIGCNARNITI